MTNEQQILVIYHADCLDGLGAAWCAFRKFSHNACYIAARFGEKFPDFSEGAIIYILDFSYPPQLLLEAAQKATSIILIDHHITAQEQYQTFFATRSHPKNLSLLFDMSHSACVLSWQYFFPSSVVPKILLHIEDRDLWQFKLEGTPEINSALYEQMPMSFKVFGEQKLSKLLPIGRIQVAQFSKMVHRLAKSSHSVTVAGKCGLAVNAPTLFSSELGHSLATESGTFGMTYCYDGSKAQWLFSLRSVDVFNVGHLAQFFGGGGHVNAAGFVLVDNPFLPQSLAVTEQVR
jgi:nanoRNase/pAp phosphatase (c-di-AMP/oligoRNAs hydrolase)